MTEHVIIGMDPHKSSNTIVVMTRDETMLTRRRFVNSDDGFVILGEVGDVSRFPNRDHFASYTGTSPISASSGERQRHRFNRAGNRRLNHAFHIAAITQIRQDTPGRVLYRRKMAEGKTHKEALRCLKRRISDAVWRQLRANRSDDQTHDTKWPRWPSKRGNLVAYRSPDSPRRNGRPKQFKPATV